MHGIHPSTHQALVDVHLSGRQGLVLQQVNLLVGVQAGAQVGLRDGLAQCQGR